MRIIACLFLFAFTICIFSCNHQKEPKWVKFHESANGVYSFDENSKIKMEKGVYRYWVKIVYSEKGGANEQVTSSLVRQPAYSLHCVEIRCAYRDGRFPTDIFYDSGGKLIESVTMTEEELKKKGWEPFAPGSRGDDLYQAACK